MYRWKYTYQQDFLHSKMNHLVCNLLLQGDNFIFLFLEVNQHVKISIEQVQLIRRDFVQKTNYKFGYIIL